MMLIFDTSIIIDLERRYQPTIEKIDTLRKQHPLPAHVTFVTAFEMHLGIIKKSVKRQEEALAFLHQFSVLNTSPKTPLLLAELKAKYDKLGVKLPLADLLIAVLTIENYGLLVTKDKDFAHIEELKKIIL